MADSPKIRLSIPRQDLAEFTPFPLTIEGARSWADSLPVVNTMAAAQLLARALGDSNRSRISPETRFDILESLRANLEIALTSLGKRYLKQPLVMPEEPGRMAALAEELLVAAGTAYTIVALETIRSPDGIVQIHPARLACQAIQRAMHYAGLKVLQSLQLYQPLPPQSWRTLHQLYALAQNQQLQDLPVQREGAPASSIKSTYLQALILSCCKPNQLRQSDLSSIYSALAQWSDLIALEESGDSSALYTVDLASDQPPMYSSLWADSAEQQRLRIDTEPLVKQLRQLKQQEAAGNRERPGSLEVAERNNGSGDYSTLAPHLLDHLIHSLGSMSLRNFKRTPSRSMLRVCIGLSSTHYHVAGRTDFESLTQDAARAGSAKRSGAFPSPDKADVWSDASTGRDYVGNEWLPGQAQTENSEQRDRLDQRTREELLEEVEVQLPLDQRYPTYKVQLTNASPGGYCLEWREDLPGEVRTGDIFGIREEHATEWMIAVVRWLSRLESSHSLIGLELVSPRAVAFGAQVQHNNSAGAAMRVLLLPDIKLVGQAPTLITPRTGFREGQRISLLNRQEKKRVQLLRKLSATASYSQFEFDYVQELGDVLTQGDQALKNSPYDSLWSNI